MGIARAAARRTNRCLGLASVCNLLSFVISTVNFLTALSRGMDAFEAVMYVALGFAPTLAALELAWKMGEKIGGRGEVAPVAKAR